MPQHPVERGRPSQDIVREMKERRIGTSLELRLFCRCADQRDVFIRLDTNASACLNDHRGALFDADDMTGSTDFTLESFKAQPGAATDVEHRFAKLEFQPFDGPAADGLEQSKFEVIGGSARLVLGKCGASIWALPQELQQVARFPSGAHG
jgi:hypothetical protein